MTTTARVFALIAAVTVATIAVNAQGQQGGDIRARGRGTQAAKVIPRTPWGAPDLQGLWNTNTLVPFARDQKYGTRAVMTEQEHAAALADLQQIGRASCRESG